MIVWLSLLTCLAMFAMLVRLHLSAAAEAIAALVIIGAASFAGEWVYRRWTGRTIKEEILVLCVRRLFIHVILGRAPISGLPEIGTCMSKSAKADLEWARARNP